MTKIEVDYDESYFGLDDDTLQRILETVENKVDSALHRHAGEDWSDYSIGNIVADIAYPILSDEFEKQFNEIDYDDLEELCNELLDDIDYGEELYDYIEQLVEDYNIIIEE